VKSRDRASPAYDRAVDEVEFAAGERVLLWDDVSALALGRKLRTHWLGPYKVEEKMSPVSYILHAEGSARSRQSHASMDESGRGKRTRSKRLDVAGLPACIALDYGETGEEWMRGVPGASRGTEGFGLGSPS
jgi:hypothetical protein